MHINIVTVSSGWILQKIAERTATNNKLPNVTFSVSHAADPNSINYYVDLQNCYNRQKTKLDIAYFTHADLNSEQWLINLMKTTGGYALNGITSMNQRYTDMLMRIGYPKEKLITLVPGQTRDTFPLKKIKIGIVSRGGYEGYGQFFMENVLQNYDFNNFELRFLGKGWERLMPIANSKGIKIQLLDDSDYSIYPTFYQNIDYLLIPGLWTAGPMSMQEALSTGIPIIGANVGFVNYEFKADYVFEPNNVSQLIAILNIIQTPLLNRRKQVENMTWENFSLKVVEFIKKIGNIQ